MNVIKVEECMGFSIAGKHTTILKPHEDRIRYYPKMNSLIIILSEEDIFDEKKHENVLNAVRGHFIQLFIIPRVVRDIKKTLLYEQYIHPAFTDKTQITYY